MKLRGRKFFKIGKLKTMIAGGISRKAQPYVYAGAKSKTGLSAGASIGTRGKQLYTSYNKRRYQVRVKYNLTTQTTTPRIRLFNKKKKYRR